MQLKFKIVNKVKTHIVDKLKRFLNQDTPLEKECGVVYLMVELRKLLDREKEEGTTRRYPLVRFHADWTLHTRKDRITATMEEIMEKVDNSLDPYPKDGNLNFLLMPEFRRELTDLPEKYKLPNQFCRNDNEWLGFISTMTQVLADQPLVNPTENIAEFRYVDMRRKGIMANIDFRGNKTGGSITLGFGL